ncbi:MAG TPA: RNA polymerase sigma factor [Bacteroidales bacterium]|nr:RNA polymerase sigma factor [Bacteroidales bacterium]
MESLVSLYQKYGVQIYNLAYRMTGNRDDASDILQETFVKAAQSIHSFKGESHIYTWLYQIARNNCLQFLEKKKRSSFTSLQELVYRASSPVSDEISETQKSLYIEQVKNGCLAGLLRCLSMHQRLVFVLNVLLDVPIIQVSVVIGKSENATRVLISRARQNIREFLCNNCSLYNSANPCCCENLINFSLKQGWIGASEAVFFPKIEKEIKDLKREIGLYKTLNEEHPAKCIEQKIMSFLENKKDFLIFSGKKVK